MKFADADDPTGLRFLQTTLCLLLVIGLVGGSRADDALAEQETQRRLTHLSPERLGNTEVTSVSKEPVKIIRTPAAIYVITQEDIRRSGATSIPESLRWLPALKSRASIP